MDTHDIQSYCQSIQEKIEKIAQQQPDLTKVCQEMQDKLSAAASSILEVKGWMSVVLLTDDEIERLFPKQVNEYKRSIQTYYAAKKEALEK